MAIDNSWRVSILISESDCGGGGACDAHSFFHLELLERNHQLKLNRVSSLWFKMQSIKSFQYRNNQIIHQELDFKLVISNQINE